MEDIYLQFRGFAPSAFARTFLKEVLHRIQEEAPANAFVRAHVSRTRDGFKGYLRVASPVGEFFAIARESSIPQLAHRLEERLHRRLDRWKGRRFRRSPTRAERETHAPTA